MVCNDQCSALRLAMECKLNTAIFWKTINIRNVKLYVMVVLIELYRSYNFQ